MNARERMLRSREQQEREAEIAECECGAQVRHNGIEWVHAGPCERGR